MWNGHLGQVKFSKHFTGLALTKTHNQFTLYPTGWDQNPESLKKIRFRKCCCKGYWSYRDRMGHTDNTWFEKGWIIALLRRMLKTQCRRPTWLITIPQIDEVIDSFEEAIVVFILDASNVYLQVEDNETNRDNTAITSHHWLYRFVQIHCGTKSTQESFFTIYECHHVSSKMTVCVGISWRLCCFLALITRSHQRCEFSFVYFKTCWGYPQTLKCSFFAATNLFYQLH